MLVNGNTEIIGIGGYVPDEVVKSDDLLSEIQSEKRFGLK